MCKKKLFVSHFRAVSCRHFWEELIFGELIAEKGRLWGPVSGTSKWISAFIVATERATGLSLSETVFAV
jgi:hypothetical protein